METNEKQQHLKFFGIPKILPFLKNVRGQILAMVILAILSSFVDITIPQFQRYALDTFVGKSTMATIVPFVLCYVAVILLASVVNYISCAQATIVEMKVNRELRQTGFKHLQTLSFSYFNQNSVGYLCCTLQVNCCAMAGYMDKRILERCETPNCRSLQRCGECPNQTWTWRIKIGGTHTSCNPNILQRS